MKENKDFEKGIKQARQYFAKATSDLKKDECELFLDSKTDKHYTVVVLIPSDIASNMHKFQKTLLEFDPTLMANKKELFHLTLTYFSSDMDIEKVAEFVKDYFKNADLGFFLRNMYIAPKGIGVAAYPMSDHMVKFRKKLEEQFDIPFPHGGFEHFSWITLARYSKKPSQEIIDYIKSHFEKDFGSFKVSKIDIYESSDKNLNGAKRLYTIPVGLK